MARGLGRGLDAFFPEIKESDKDTVQEIPVNECRPNPYQPRKKLSADAIEELKETILEYGIIQPLIAQKSIKGYLIVVGESGFRAAKKAKLDVFPAIAKDFTDERVMAFALLENLQ